MQNNPDINQLAFEFFKEFSRSEYALKAAGFHSGDGDAKASWDKFAKRVEGLVQTPNSVELQNAIDFVIEHPPKKQKIVNGKIEWCDVSPNQPSKAKNLLSYVRRVRNNLFHGGKFNPHWVEPARSKNLIINCLFILKACIEHVDSTRNARRG